MNDPHLDQSSPAHALYATAHDLLAFLARDHESCCSRSAYALELAADELYAGAPRSTRIQLPRLTTTPGLNRRRLALLLLEHLIPLAATRDEEQAIISAHHWTSLAHLDH